MVRPAKLIPSIAMGLILGWQASPVQSQQSATYRGPERAADYKELADDSEGFSEGDGAIETIRERYPNGTIKIEREMTQDPHGNYITHGSWKMFDQKGNLSAQGMYDHGNRTGEWIRWYASANEAETLTRPPYQQFSGPFISQATFDRDQLHGTWTVYDGKKKKISEIKYLDGKREGIATWWFPNGHKMREVQYQDGEMNGPYTEWNAEGNPTVKDSYQSGRKLASKTTSHQGGGKKSEGTYLHAKEIDQTSDDWWNFKFAKTVKTGHDEKHGLWTSWHSNGQKQLEGNYEHDLQTGKFTWWHANGQKALEGRYTEGKQNGEWTWWYDTGQKSIRGEYAIGTPTGRWTWWKEDGKVSQSADLAHSEGVVIDTPKTLDPKQMPRASKPLNSAPVKR